MNGAVYVSITIEVGAEDGSLASRTGGVINDTGFDIDSDGHFTIHLGGSADTRNWLALGEAPSRITTRHYYEEALCAAGNPGQQPVLSIEVLNRPEVPPPPSDDSIAQSIRRATQFVRPRTLGMTPMMTEEPVPFLSLEPNSFPKPVPPGNFGLAAVDAAYSMAPYVLGPDDALVITGRWPRCRCANVCLWARHQQTFDYINRPVSLNRAQTQLQPDGSFRMVLAHRDPCIANWIDTEGRPYGLVFWRVMLAEGEIETPQAKVVPFASFSD